ncbi:MAG: hypothetical protein JO186_03785 [Actinobacteria bacterium]|nr:hypothetical protein [Actinomycetota bacterium]MBV8396687.1 hypothetical protein [Actinomycetota bacterium]MBV8599834.1 hypothetical protein [Actinomycetota bacterium]
MPRRKLATGMLLGLGSLAGSLLYRRRAARQRERIDLYAADGSMVSVSDGSPDAPRLLAAAREVIRQAEL